MLEGWVALTGTPGVGKTEVADRLRLRAIPNVDLGRFAHDYDLIEGIDPQRTSAIVDPVRVGKHLAKFVQKGALTLLDGHWSHEVPGVEAAIVLRLAPPELEQRLKRRGWPPTKIRENLEAEAVDVVLQEAVGRLGRRRVFEIDVTDLPLEEVERHMYRILRGPSRQLAPYRPGKVNWSQHVLAWY